MKSIIVSIVAACAVISAAAPSAEAALCVHRSLRISVRDACAEQEREIDEPTVCVRRSGKLDVRAACRGNLFPAARDLGPFCTRGRSVVQRSTCRDYETETTDVALCVTRSGRLLARQSCRRSETSHGEAFIADRRSSFPGNTGNDVSRDGPVIVVQDLPERKCNALPIEQYGESDADIDAYIHAEMCAQSIPGLALAIVQDGKITYVKGYGWEDVEKGIPVHGRLTRFRWASVSKTVTGVAAALATEADTNLDGTPDLDLDADIKVYYDGYRPDGDENTKITTRQLLSHLGGIRHYREPMWLFGWDGLDKITPPKDKRNDPNHNTGIEWALRHWKNQPLIHPPGQQYHYSTAGFNLAGAVIGRAVGQKFWDWVRTQIAEPLGMSTFQPDYHWDPAPYRAELYNRDWSGADDSDVSWKLPGGGFISTVEDMARFCAGVGNKAILSGPATALLFEPNISEWDPATPEDDKVEPYGLGWRVGWSFGAPVRYHRGEQDGARTSLALYPDTNVCVLVMMNWEGTDEEQQVERITAEVERMLFEDRGGAIVRGSPPPATPVSKNGIPIESFQRTVDEVVTAGYYRPVSLDGYLSNGDTLVNAVFAPTDGTDWLLRFGLTSEQYQRLSDEMVAQRWRLLHVDAYRHGDEIRYAAIFIDESGPPQIAYHGVDAAWHQRRFDELTAQGYHTVVVSRPRDVNGVERITALYEQSAPSTRQMEFHVEPSTDRPGRDYRGFEIYDAYPSYRTCENACRDEVRCQSYTYVKPGIQGPRARCWLKDGIPEKRATDIGTSGVKYYRQIDVNLPGSDYYGFELDAYLPWWHCARACAASAPRCKAWTYVEPGIQSEGGHCWLKDSVPGVVADGVAVSGWIGTVN